MNIFILDEDPIVCASFHCDKHVCKMIVETAQMLCTTHHVLEPSKDIPYKKTHVNHPSTIWARHAYGNYVWLLRLATALLVEYTRRYGRIHKTESVIDWIIKNALTSEKFTVLVQTPFALCMPDEYKSEDAVTSYRKFYIAKKASFAKWNYSDKPDWFKN